MVAYSFKPQFETPILTRRKTGTIRSPGKRRHARPGETLQLYTGMRTPSCRLIARAVCTVVEYVRIDFSASVVIVHDGQTIQAVMADENEFARADGFRDFDHMAQFWWDTHKLRYVHEHVWIQWDPSTVTPAGTEG